MPLAAAIKCFPLLYISNGRNSAQERTRLFRLGLNNPKPTFLRYCGLLTGIISSSSSKLAATENQLLCVRLGPTGSILALTVRLSLVPGRAGGTIDANLSSSSESLYDEERFRRLEKLKLGIDLENALRRDGGKAALMTGRRRGRLEQTIPMLHSTFIQIAALTMFPGVYR